MYVDDLLHESLCLCWLVHVPSKVPVLSLVLRTSSTPVRIYEGTLRRGDFIINCMTGKKVKVPRLVRMHASDLEVSSSGGLV